MTTARFILQAPRILARDFMPGFLVDARAREALGRGVADYTFSTSAAALSAPTAAGTPA